MPSRFFDTFDRPAGPSVQSVEVFSSIINEMFSDRFDFFRGYSSTQSRPLPVPCGIASDSHRDHKNYLVPYLFFHFSHIHDVKWEKCGRSTRIAGGGRCSERAEPSVGLGCRV